MLPFLEGHIIFYSSQEKYRWGAFETDEGGPEKQFIIFIWPIQD